MNVRFFAGTKNDYLSLSSPRNPLGLYFCADTKELFWADRLLTDGTRIVPTFADLPSLGKAADGITYFVEETRNGYVLSSDRTKWVQVIYAPESGTGSSSIKAISFAGIEMEEAEGVFTIDRRCAREALGFIVPDGMEADELEIATKEYVDSQIAKVPGADLDLSEYVKHEDIASLATKKELAEAIEAIEYPAVDLSDYATKEFVINKIAEAELNNTDIDISGLATKEELSQVEAKIPSIEELASEAYVDEKIAEIAIPEVPVKVSELENDAGYITASDVPSIDLTGYATTEALEAVEAKIPSDYLTAIPSEYITTTELSEAIAQIDIPDVSNFITEEEVESKGFLTEHQDISGKSDIGHKHTISEITDYTAPEIPSLDGYATEQYVDNAIAAIPGADLSAYSTTAETTTMISSAVAVKADEIPFKADKYVTNALGNFLVGDSLKGLTIAAILAKLLGLTDKNPSEPEPPVEPDGVIDIIIANKIPMYSINGSSTVALLPYEDIITYTKEESLVPPTSSGFYQVVNESGERIEAGYQELTVENLNVPYIIALPIDVDFNTMVTVQTYDTLENKWKKDSLKMTSDLAAITDLCNALDIDISHIDTTQYTIWANLEASPTGKIHRFIIEE